MTCSHERTYFDRSLCPEPCDTMHDRCKDCGATVGDCAHETDRKHMSKHARPAPSPHQRLWADIIAELRDAETIALLGANQDIHAAHHVTVQVDLSIPADERGLRYSLTDFADGRVHPGGVVTVRDEDLTFQGLVVDVKGRLIALDVVL